MSLGQRLMCLRKAKQLSQEQMAEKLNVTRQTVSKWETDQSTPDFDKIVPLCDLFGISPNELFNSIDKNDDNRELNYKGERKKYAIELVISILLFFMAPISMMIGIPILKLNPIFCTAIFMFMVGLGVCLIVYTKIVYKRGKAEIGTREDSTYKQVDNIISTIILILYLIISFMTESWHITWIIWLLKALIMQIVKLILSLKGE